MGMMVSLLRVSKEALDSYIENSQKLVERFQEEIKRSTGATLKVGKSWYGVKRLIIEINKEEQGIDLEDILFSGQFVDDSQDLGYGPAHYLLPEQVNKFCLSLDHLDFEKLQTLDDPNKNAELRISTSSWYDSKDELEFIVQSFRELEAFYKMSKEKNQSVITKIS